MKKDSLIPILFLHIKWEQTTETSKITKTKYDSVSEMEYQSKAIRSSIKTAIFG